jgi:hypothetical protein
MAIRSDARVMATAHMLLNLTTVALFGAAFLVQVDDGALIGDNLTLVIALHVVAAGLLSVSGVLGGEMAHRHHLAIVPDPGAEREEERRHLGQAV